MDTATEPERPVNNQSAVLEPARRPGVVLVGEGHRTDALTDKVDREGHLEESLHLTRMETRLLESGKNDVGAHLLVENVSFILHRIITNWRIIDHLTITQYGSSEKRTGTRGSAD